MVQVKVRRTRRRKGKRRPPTIGGDCRHLAYSCGRAICMRKVRANEERQDDIKYGCMKAFEDDSCAKDKYCGYEPEDCATVTRLAKKGRG